MTATGFDVEKVRGDFPILQERVHDRALVYLDNAATSQKPMAVIDAMSDYYRRANANVHRGVHELADRADRAYEGARVKVGKFLGVDDARQIVFTRGTTESINLVVHSYARARLQAGDRVVISIMEHHANFVPWQQVCEQAGAELVVLPITADGELDMNAFGEAMDDRVKIVALAHVSNVLGTINPVKQIVAKAHAVGAVVMLDGAQAVPHMRVDVVDLDCDFYAFSSHKMFGPTGVGVLYGKYEHLTQMEPYQFGGDMILDVRVDGTDFNVPPMRFEAGTPNMAGAVGLAAAIDYLDGLAGGNGGAVGGEDGGGVHQYEDALMHYAIEQLATVDGLKLTGNAAERVGTLSFTIEGVHPYDLSPLLDRRGIAIRVGHHCAQPLMDHLGVASTARASLAFYNTRAEVDALVAGLVKGCALLRA